MPQLSNQIPLSLYIHMPWCVQKCPYCDFNSHAFDKEFPEKRYIDFLIEDFKQKVSLAQERPLYSIFIGGGTPSLFSAESYDRLFKAIRSELDWSTNIEITLEANPGASEQSRFQGFFEAGINRLSIGVQSFQNEKLSALGRIHNSDQAIQAIESAKAAGFSNINLDLMYGLPKQSLEDAMADLAVALKLNTPHLSWYQLTIEPNTYFFQFPPMLPQDEITWDIQQQGQALLQAHHRLQYEISAYSTLGFNCRHNLNYWEFGDYLAIGAGAHGKITDFKNQKIRRYANVKHPKLYMRETLQFLEIEKEVSAKELHLEFMMNVLRLQKPIPISLFAERTGLAFATLEKSIAIAIEKNLLIQDSHSFQVTTFGKKFLNELLEIFL
jgi:putative oxygen-independent coproporphyrinogen III oxidase